MNSTSFPATVSPMMTGMQPRQGFDSGGQVTTPFNLPNDIGQALYGTPPSVAQQQEVAQNAFLQGDAGGIPTGYAKGGTVRKPHNHLVIIMPLTSQPGGALSRGMAPQQSGPSAGDVLSTQAHVAMAAVQKMVAMVSALPGVDPQAIAAAKMHLKQGADLLLAAAQGAAQTVTQRGPR